MPSSAVRQPATGNSLPKKARLPMSDELSERPGAYLLVAVLQPPAGAKDRSLQASPPGSAVLPHSDSWLSGG